MAADSIPDDLRDFVLRVFDTVAHLEALLLLRAHPDKSWDVPTTAKRLYTTEQQAAEALDRLQREGFIAAEGGAYRYLQEWPVRLAKIDRLAEIYAKHLVEVTNLIHERPRRIREFPDAFKFKKD